MPAPDKLLHLIEVFDRNAEGYRRGSINETETRVQFIDPLFELLGWDVHNARGYSEAFKDVVHEDAVRIEGTPSAPDYSFRVGGQRVFFLEAKKPSINIEQDASPALQLRRYGWTCKLPLGVVTDFEEFAVYDTRIKPVKTDKSSVARVQFIPYRQYPDKWDEIAAIFSKEAVLQGSFHKYAESATAKKGTADVDDAFLADIEQWRDILARNIALRNPAILQRELNFAVQKIIDRIVFLRMCEDRGIEPYGQLLALGNGTQAYPRLVELFLKADQRYNSGLFHFSVAPASRRQNQAADTAALQESPDDLTPRLVLDDKPFKDIFRSLYYPDCPYQFSVLPIQILGDVYEQFLGKVIRLTEGHQAKIEYKPEVKKAGGVQYTPAFVTANIVKNTVGKLISRIIEKAAAINDAAKQFSTVLAAVDKLKICDPACGSGSFLIAAYQCLLDWYLQWYVQHEALALKAKQSPIYIVGSKGEAARVQGSGFRITATLGLSPTDAPAHRCTDAPNFRLTTAEKKRILLNSIYGVDIDSQAVEVTKLSLLLKVLEGENQESMNTQLKLFHERALPDLSSNIKCGNSLIGPEFYEHQQMDLLDEDERRRINVFDWKAAFPQVFGVENPGFDVVLMNPPYVRIQGFPRNQIEYITKHYLSATRNCDLYVSFVEKAFYLLNPVGVAGIILPNKFFKTDYGLGLRKFISDRKAVDQIVDFGAHQVFSSTTYTCLLFLNACGADAFLYGTSEADEHSLSNTCFSTLQSDRLTAASWLFTTDLSGQLLCKLTAKGKRLLELPADMSRGSSSGNDAVFMIEAGTDLENAILRTPVFATDFNRYRFNSSGAKQIIFPYHKENGRFSLYDEEELSDKFPKAYRYLQSHKDELKKRKQYRQWYSYSAPRNLELHDRADIIIPLLANRGLCALIPNHLNGSLCPMASGGFTITVRQDECGLSPNYLLGLLNSRLVFWILSLKSNVFRGGWITCTKQYVGELPIRTIDFTDATDKQWHDQMVKYVDTMLALHKQLAAARTPDDRTQLENQIAATDRLIDKLVYELYDLTDEEIKIVEGMK